MVSANPHTLLTGQEADATKEGGRLHVADGLIAGTGFKTEGRTNNPVDPERVRAFIKAVR